MHQNTHQSYPCRKIAFFPALGFLKRRGFSKRPQLSDSQRSLTTQPCCCCCHRRSLEERIALLERQLRATSEERTHWEGRHHDLAMKHRQLEILMAAGGAPDQLQPHDGKLTPRGGQQQQQAAYTPMAGGAPMPDGPYWQSTGKAAPRGSQVKRMHGRGGEGEGGAAATPLPAGQGPSPDQQQEAGDGAEAGRGAPGLTIDVGRGAGAAHSGPSPSAQVQVGNPFLSPDGSATAGNPFVSPTASAEGGANPFISPDGSGSAATARNPFLSPSSSATTAAENPPPASLGDAARTASASSGPPAPGSSPRVAAAAARLMSAGAAGSRAAALLAEVSTEEADPWQATKALQAQSAELATRVSEGGQLWPCVSGQFACFETYPKLYRANLPFY